MFELLALLRQSKRCRRGDHEWTESHRGVRSDLMTCLYCPEIGYRIKETSPRG